ncbi:MAG: peroxidase-related enzyme [Phycisphaerales bacterium]|nr:peroxidase-related enzyme [Phycisphaerales bacterium]
MAHIDIIAESDARGELAVLYKRYGNPDGAVDNVLKVHSLNPASLAAHCALYVQACHAPGPVSRAEREIVGVVVSRLNGCDYCREHHAAGLRRLLPEDRRLIADMLARGDEADAPLSERERAIVVYASKLTRSPAAITRADTGAMRAAGLTDREILDTAQVAAYFAYANRIVLGLGAELGVGEGGAGEWPADST